MLTFDGKGGPRGALPALLHFDAATGWCAVEYGDVEHGVVARRTSLSPFLAGWFTYGLRWLGDRVEGRTDPATCPSAAPKWVSLTRAKVDVTTSCLSNNNGRAELRLRNNRGLPIEVGIPAGVAYAAVAGQSEPVRKILRGYLGGDKVLLLSGQEVTNGWQRPRADAVVTVDAGFTGASVLPGIALELIGADDAESLAAVAFVLARCAGADELLLDALVGTLVKQLVTCFAKAAVSPSGSIAVAVSAIAAAYSQDKAVVTSDRQFAGKLASGLRLLGKLVKFYTVAKLAVRSASLAPTARTRPATGPASCGSPVSTTRSIYDGCRSRRSPCPPHCAAPPPTSPSTAARPHRSTLATDRSTRAWASPTSPSVTSTARARPKPRSPSTATTRAATASSVTDTSFCQAPLARSPRSVS